MLLYQWPHNMTSALKYHLFTVTSCTLCQDCNDSMKCTHTFSEPFVWTTCSYCSGINGISRISAANITNLEDLWCYHHNCVRPCCRKCYGWYCLIYECRPWFRCNWHLIVVFVAFCVWATFMWTSALTSLTSLYLLTMLHSHDHPPWFQSCFESSYL